ncbi:Uncharacterized protein PBTT_06545 [Plasmodiophora brassicae]
MRTVIGVIVAVLYAVACSAALSPATECDQHFSYIRAQATYREASLNSTSWTTRTMAYVYRNWFLTYRAWWYLHLACARRVPRPIVDALNRVAENAAIPGVDHNLLHGFKYVDSQFDGTLTKNTTTRLETALKVLAVSERLAEHLPIQIRESQTGESLFQLFGIIDQLVYIDRSIENSIRAGHVTCLDNETLAEIREHYHRAQHFHEAHGPEAFGHLLLSVSKALDAPLATANATLQEAFNLIQATIDAIEYTQQLFCFKAW